MKNIKINNVKRKISTTSPIPVYYQIATDIKMLCIHWELNIGDKIPSEIVLAQVYSVSRVTIRQALDILVNEKIIKKINGIGSILISDPKPIFLPLEIPGNTNKLSKINNFLIKPKILTICKKKPIPEFNKLLNISKEEYLIYIKRIFLYGTTPIGINRSWLNPQLVPSIVEKGLIDDRLSYTLKENYNLKPVSVSNEIGMGFCSATDMELLNITTNTPIFSINSISKIEGDIPLEISKTFWLGDKVKFVSKSSIS